MAGYVDFPFDESAEDAAQRILEGIAARIPGWVPSGEGTLEVALAEEIGREISDLRRLTVDVAAATVRTFGQSLFGVTYLGGSAASISARITVAQAGGTVPAGFMAVGTNADGFDVVFYLTADAVFASNATNKTVTLLATVPGASGNGVPIGPLRIGSATPNVVSVDALSVSGGGSDPETDDKYQDRLVASLGTLTRTPILPRDFAVRAEDVAGVYRATAVDGYDPDTGSTSAERTVTVFAVDQSGAYVGTTVSAQVRTLLDSLREANFVVKVAAPIYSTITVAFVAVAKDGYDPAAVNAAIVARGQSYLSPASWGGGGEDPPSWINEPIVRYLDLAAALDAVDGVDYLTSLTINGSASDFTMPGVAPLPSASSVVSGSVS